MPTLFLQTILTNTTTSNPVWTMKSTMERFLSAGKLFREVIYLCLYKQFWFYIVFLMHGNDYPFIFINLNIYCFYQKEKQLLFCYKSLFFLCLNFSSTQIKKYISLISNSSLNRWVFLLGWLFTVYTGTYESLAVLLERTGFAYCTMESLFVEFHPEF